MYPLLLQLPLAASTVAPMLSSSLSLVLPRLVQSRVCLVRQRTLLVQNGVIRLKLINKVQIILRLSSLLLDQLLFGWSCHQLLPNMVISLRKCTRNNLQVLFIPTFLITFMVLGKLTMDLKRLLHLGIFASAVFCCNKPSFVVNQIILYSYLVVENLLFIFFSMSMILLSQTTHHLQSPNSFLFLSAEFAIAVKDLGYLCYFVALQAIHTSKGLFLCQKNYVTDLLFKFHMHIV